MTEQNDNHDHDAPPPEEPGVPQEAAAGEVVESEAVAADAAPEGVGPDGGLEAAAESAPEAAPDEPRVGHASEELKAVIEALVYASPDPLTPKTLFKVLESEPREDVQASLEALLQDYAGVQGGLQLVEVAGGYQIVTRPELSE
jgi:hypothetical protein